MRPKRRLAASTMFRSELYRPVGAAVSRHAARPRCCSAPGRSLHAARLPRCQALPDTAARRTVIAWSGSTASVLVAIDQLGGRRGLWKRRKGFFQGETPDSPAPPSRWLVAARPWRQPLAASVWGARSRRCVPDTRVRHRSRCVVAAIAAGRLCMNLAQSGIQATQADGFRNRSGAPQSMPAAWSRARATMKGRVRRTDISSGDPCPTLSTARLEPSLICRYRNSRRSVPADRRE